MKIVALLGSPRVNGNSSTIARRLCAAAEGLGAEVKTYALNNLEYRGCQACMTCKTELDRCVLQDDLTEVLEAVREADALVLATPIYFGEVSSQMKAFIDRTYSFLGPDYRTNPNPSRLAPGKRLVFITIQGHPDEKQFADVFPRYDFFFRWYGFAETRLIRGCGIFERGEIETRPDLIELAGKTARAIVERG